MSQDFTLLVADFRSFVRIYSQRAQTLTYSSKERNRRLTVPERDASSCEIVWTLSKRNSKTVALAKLKYQDRLDKQLISDTSCTYKFHQHLVSHQDLDKVLSNFSTNSGQDRRLRFRSPVDSAPEHGVRKTINYDAFHLDHIVLYFLDTFCLVLSLIALCPRFLLAEQRSRALLRKRRCPAASSSRQSGRSLSP
jgi:hypothetical protein